MVAMPQCRCYHEALGVRAEDPLAVELLSRALRESVDPAIEDQLGEFSSMRLDG
jgi:hypothetical protein